MPFQPVDVCNVLIEQFTPFEDTLTIDAIDRYLMRKKFARHMAGFLFFSIAVENCLENPKVLTDLDKLLYPRIAEITLTTPQYVKKAIRLLTENASRRGFTCYNYNRNMRIGNREFLALCADDFADRHLKTLYKSNSLKTPDQK